MSKSVLGRGLDSLLGDAKAPKSLSDVAAEPAASEPVTPGVGSLLRGTSAEKNVFAAPAPVATPAPEPVTVTTTEVAPQPQLSTTPFSEPAKAASPLEQPAPLLPPWYFFAADFVLTAIAIAVFVKSPSPTWKEIAFGVSAIALGGLLAIVGVLLRKD